MSETVYTVDVLGDTGLVEALITRSLTEFIDESCSKLGPRALAGATNLTKVQCDNVTTVEKEVFSGCKALKTLSLPKVTSVTKCEYATASPGLPLDSGEANAAAHAVLHAGRSLP